MTPSPCRQRCLKGVTALAASPWKAVSYGDVLVHSFHPCRQRFPPRQLYSDARGIRAMGRRSSSSVLEFPLHPILAGPFVMVMRR